MKFISWWNLVSGKAAEIWDEMMAISSLLLTIHSMMMRERETERGTERERVAGWGLGPTALPLL